MNTIIIKGGLLQTAGKLKQCGGRILHNNYMYYSGKGYEWIGKAIKQYGYAINFVKHIIK